MWLSIFQHILSGSESMIKNVAHIGFTVSNLERTVAFYQDVLQMVCVGHLEMAGKETEALFAQPGTKIKVAYMKRSADAADPAVELIEFISPAIEKRPCSLFRTSISELCFQVENIDAFYQRLLDNNVEVLSSPQFYDATAYDMGKSRTIYFKDPDGIILEATEEV